MSTDNTAQVTSLPHLAESLPYLLGHYPDDSIALHSPGSDFFDGPTMTYPLPDDPAEWKTTAELAARQFVAYAQEGQGHDPGQGVIVYLCREPRADQTPWDTATLLAPVSDWLTAALHEQRATVLRTIGLVSNRWWAYECLTEGCCEGEPLPSADDSTSITAQMARLGRTPGPRTRDILKEFRPTAANPDFLKDLNSTIDQFNSRCATNAGRDATLTTTWAQIDAAVSQFRAGATTLNHALTAQLIVGLHDDDAVDAGIVHTDDDLPHARRLWAYLARHCADPFTQEAVPALTLYAFAAWRQGDLIAARLALRHAITADPEYDLAIGIHIGTIDGENSRDFLATARENHDQRRMHVQHTVQVASEYRPVTGSTAHRQREALDTAAKYHGTQASTHRGQLRARYRTIDAIGRALADFRNGPPRLTDEIAARIILGLQDPETRDAALSTGDENNLPTERQLWGRLAGRCVPPHADKAPPLLTLLGWVAWRQNDTITASHAFSDALDIDPDHRLAKLLIDGIRTGCDPAAFLAIYREAAQRFADGRADFDNL
ncbi:DUF4192 domain-containing protein [Streptomyces sp. NPDC058045]|uniref:DUF4192 domain-containing protein n=1 Tax=Streptomyces sp. NPDC058045 TaxID=3346311 RepID=UPI0036E4A965